MGRTPPTGTRLAIFATIAMIFYGILLPIWGYGIIKAWKRRHEPLFFRRHGDLAIAVSTLAFFYCFLQKPVTFLQVSIDENHTFGILLDVLNKFGQVIGLQIPLSMFSFRAYLCYYDISFAKATEEGKR